MAQDFNIEKFGELPHDAIVWRHLDLLKFLSLLIDKELFFPNSHYFAGDKREGTFSEAQENELAASYEVTLPPADVQGALNRHQFVKQLMEGMARTKYFISCWYRSPHESDAMWKLYSGDVALKTTVGRLHDCIGNTVNTRAGVAMQAYISNVKYIDFSNANIWDQLNGGSVIDMVLHKRQFFDFEKEVRIVLEAPVSIEQIMETGNLTGTNGTYRSGGECFNCKPKKESASVAVNIEQLIEEIVYSPYSTTQLKGVVKHFAEIHCPGVLLRD